MRKIFVSFLILTVGSILFASSIGIVQDEDFRKVGVTQENIDKAKKVIEEARVQYKIKTLDKKTLELQINKYMLEGTEKNIDKLNELVEKVSIIDSEIMKDRLKYKVEVQKYITTEQYLKARELRLNKLYKGRE